jgi:adenylosuccinate synthase
LNNDDIKKRRLVQNAQNIGMVNTVFEALVNNKSFSEICNFLRSHAIRHNQQRKEKNARQIHTTCQPMGTTKKDKVKTVLALIHELQLQDSTGSDDEVDISASSKTAMICKLEQLPSKILIALIMLNRLAHTYFIDSDIQDTTNPLRCLRLPTFVANILLPLPTVIFSLMSFKLNMPSKDLQ